MSEDLKPPLLRMSLVFLMRGEQILLAMKRRGFGQGLYNGVGGKVQAGESIIEAATRECMEEVKVKPLILNPIAKLTFINQGQSDNLVFAFSCDKWEGTPSNSEEMRPKWFNLSTIPYDKMWECDSYWIPRVLANEKITGVFYFDNQDRLLDYHIDADSKLDLASLN